MHIPLKRLKSNGFTIVELLIVIVVIGILAALTIVAYNGVQKNVIDKAIMSDADSIAGPETRYSVNNSTGGKSWYSGTGVDADLQFTGTPGNVIDVVATSTDYCIRVFNPSAASYKTIYTAYKKESNPGVCLTIYPSDAAQPVNGSPWAKIAVGGGYTCGIKASGYGVCWGQGSYGVLGNGTLDNSNTQVAISTAGVLSGKTFKSISSTDYMSCGIASDDQGYCWGRNVHGNLGNNSMIDSNVPVAVYTSGVLSGKILTQIQPSSLGDSVCSLASDNLVYCWGFDTDTGNLGNNLMNDTSVPSPLYMGGILSGKTIKSLSFGQNGCVIASDSLAYCWGFNVNGGRGNNTTTDSLVPTAVYTGGVLSGKTIKQITSGYGTSCVIASDNLAYCWGTGSYGELGNNTTGGFSSVAVAVNTTGVLSGKTIKYIASQWDTSCVIASDNQVYCWGYNGFGQLGNGTKTDSPVPVAVSTSGVMSGKSIISLSVGSGHVCATSSDNQTFCWGSDTAGELGDSGTTFSSVPIRLFNPI